METYNVWFLPNLSVSESLKLIKSCRPLLNMSTEKIYRIIRVPKGVNHFEEKVSFVIPHEQALYLYDSTDYDFLDKAYIKKHYDLMDNED